MKLSAKQKEVVACQRTCEDTKTEFGSLYFPCPHNAKYNVKYKSPTRGRDKDEMLCGKHFKSFEKMMKRIGFEFTAIPLTNPE